MKITKKQIKAAAVKYSKKQLGKLFADNPDVVGSIVEDFIAGAEWMQLKQSLS
ncbi:hypothetical protein [uncultured Mucilaginibacter sp.]|uniref:hypothetical protein n=1 Tax=uncultured Mucilaginibacter sp. TaxID=797541 RepID=UPI0025EC1B63|nr:hypothetical protein [uncultured Mucilaginibacter sp.]